MIPQDHRDMTNRADPYTEPNSCFSESSDSLNSLNSMKVPLHLEKTPMDVSICDGRGVSANTRNIVFIAKNSRVVDQLKTFGGSFY